ncbi:pantetheine-phosphate adenylyltransferase [Alicyclobacillus acidiphilus]|uniref:pantetheine-phosphate adenylyltransferase n=1 Tax=Alicyclobacillus acidiphilus TaxID=182455 RepID=UPI000831F3BB|nr:pantetheine-phosphate adenylyltransferase [Alicyclobacillus acidiphilus]
MRRVLYPGTFDPITYGHIDILKHASSLFDEVIVGVFHNPGKVPWFPTETRVALIQEAVRDLNNVRVDSFEGLLVDYYQRESCDAVIRGIRNSQDLLGEMAMAHMNASLLPTIRTIFVPTSAANAFVSSTLVKDVAAHGGDVSHFVPPCVLRALAAKLNG